MLGAELGLEMFRVDLAGTVSKYIGETEKNLERIFSAADGSNAILFFDEADALFGKRSEVSDAHDRYANLEVAYLLQRMEAYPGAVILATNFRRNLDEAFIRRLDFVIDFPFPEPADRRRHLGARAARRRRRSPTTSTWTSWPTRFKLSGGAIRNCSLAAAFSAADEGTAIEMRHLVRAVAQEYAKQGRLTLEADFERFHARRARRLSASGRFARARRVLPSHMKVDRRLMTLRVVATAAGGGRPMLALALTALVRGGGRRHHRHRQHHARRDAGRRRDLLAARGHAVRERHGRTRLCAGAGLRHHHDHGPAAGVYVLTGGPLSLTGSATLSGAGAATTTITAAGASQVFVVGAAARRRDQRRDGDRGPRRHGVRRATPAALV